MSGTNQTDFLKWNYLAFGGSELIRQHRINLDYHHINKLSGNQYCILHGVKQVHHSFLELENQNLKLVSQNHRTAKAGRDL